MNVTGGQRKKSVFKMLIIVILNNRFVRAELSQGAAS